MKRSYQLTKSKFILGLQCEKALYLNVYQPKLAYYPPETLARFREGRAFEAKIKALFPNGIDASEALGMRMNQYPDFTSELLQTSCELTIFEAGFLYNGVLVLADVLHRDADGNIHIYEIKNSTSMKDVFIRDVSIQHYVISHCIEIKSFSVVYNDGNDNPVYEDILSQAQEAESTIAEQVESFKTMLQGFMPDVAMGDHCHTPYDCPFLRHCKRNISIIQ